MIAEYERAQIAERTQRGKQHRAKEGVIYVLCGTPMATHTAAAYYEIIEREAEIVQTV